MRNDPEDLTLLSDNGKGALDDDDVNIAAAGNLGISTLGIPRAGERPSIDVALALDERRLRSPHAKYEGWVGPSLGVGIIGIDEDSVLASAACENRKGDIGLDSG